MTQLNSFAMETMVCNDLATIAGTVAQLHAECKSYKKALAFVVQQGCFVYVKSSFRECFAVMPSGVSLFLTPIDTEDWHNGYTATYY